VVTEILLAEVLTNNTRMMLWPFAIQLTGYLHHFPGLYSQRRKNQYPTAIHRRNIYAYLHLKSVFA
jgi:hypothetical protein